MPTSGLSVQHSEGLALDPAEAFASPKHAEWRQWRTEVEQDDWLAECLTELEVPAAAAVSVSAQTAVDHRQAILSRVPQSAWVVVDPALNAGPLIAAPNAAPKERLYEQLQFAYQNLLQIPYSQTAARAQHTCRIEQLQSLLAPGWPTSRIREHTVRLMAPSPLSQTPRSMKARTRLSQLISHAQLTSHSHCLPLTHSSSISEFSHSVCSHIHCALTYVE